MNSLPLWHRYPGDPDRHGRFRLIPLGLFTAGASALILASRPPLAVAGVAVTVLSLGYDLTQPLLAGIVTDLSANRGQAMALNVFTLFAGFGLGSLVFQVLLRVGIPTALAIFGAAAVLAGVLALPAFRRESPSQTRNG